jgi:hypothetical protein
MTFLYIRGVWKNMKNTSELYFNGYESTSCMPSSASLSSGSRKYHSWVMWYHLRGIMVEPSKVKEVLDWKSPISVSEVRSFLGLASYSQWFISNFSKIAKLITELLKKGNKYVKSDACDEAFKNLKKLLTTLPVLAQPDTNKPFNVYCDASGTGLGCLNARRLSDIVFLVATKAP